MAREGSVTTLFYNIPGTIIISLLVLLEKWKLVSASAKNRNFYI